MRKLALWVFETFFTKGYKPLLFLIIFKLSCNWSHFSTSSLHALSKKINRITSLTE